MQCQTLPRIKHLHLTMENEFDISHQSRNGYENLSSLKYSPENFRQSQSSLVNLRTLQLRQVDMTNVLLLIEHVESISRLQTFILINSHVQSMTCEENIQMIDD